MFVGGLAVSGAARVAVGELGQLPVFLPLIATQHARRAGRLEGVRQALNELQLERHELGGLADEAGDTLRHQAALLGAGASLNQHLKVELLGGEALQSALTDVAKSALIHVLQESILQVGVAKLARVIVAQHTLDVGRR